MEIPFVVNARKDTGLFNSKVAIWLFLASEVTLFGGLFSGYLFLRLYADYPWPERTLPVLPGLINTFILILSSVTVVFAWAALKLRNWRNFQINMWITLICATLFMVLKSIEYKAKFSHQAVRIKTEDHSVKDFAILEGHLNKAEVKDGKLVKAKKNEEGDYSDNAFYANKIIFKADEVTFTLTRHFYDDFLYEIVKQAGETKFELVEDYMQVIIKEDGSREEEVLVNKGEELSAPAIEAAEEYFLGRRSDDAKLRTRYLKAAFAQRREAGDKRAGWEIAQSEEFLALQAEQNKEIKLRSFSAPATMTFKATEPVILHLDPSVVVSRSGNQLRLRDDTLIGGELLDSSMFLAVDGIDFRFTAQRAEEKGISAESAIEKSWVLKQPELKKVWDAHQEWLRAHVEKLDKKSDDKGLVGEDRYVPTENEKYRVNWDQMVAYHRLGYEGIYDQAATDEGIQKPGWIEGFAGADHYDEEMSKAFVKVTIPRENIGFESTFTPRWNTYYAIYFTITGLHGLHVIGGMIVLGYYLFFGRKMYESNPEWLANRVEVGGLFWHFVDLVWIFLFPILYLM